MTPKYYNPQDLLIKAESNKQRRGTGEREDKSNQTWWLRNEFRPWVDVNRVKLIKAKSQYKPPDEKVSHETSYSSQFKGEPNKPVQADNKFIDRRRIRSLYSEPFQESSKAEKRSVQPSKPKKTTTSHKPLKKAKDKQIASGRAAKKKSAESSSGTKPEDKEKRPSIKPPVLQTRNQVP
ncbi:microtubule-associated protein 6 [Trachemys scripta elegans]|uniref:microtubule-associated protein 6 n=1 Tax=Trachemys scripta elegans TaxID=31138 RepID=UPI0015542B0F|nr:microtubule-associated protein 6 [Trachemys scripta elegans]